MNTKVKFVNFVLFCHKCEYHNNAETENPCYECLGTPVRENSQTPINFKLKKRTKK